jgi:5,10-methylenetetrahydrofolate reductase
MTCRDRNRLALQADLLFASSRGIQNVLCLTGDSIMLGDHKDAKSVFDMDSSQLLETVRTLENGKDLGGNDLDGGVSFCAGRILESTVVEDCLSLCWERTAIFFSNNTI